MELKTRVRTTSPAFLTSLDHETLSAYLMRKRILLLRLSILLFVSVLFTGCAGLHSTQTSEYDPTKDLKIVQMTGNFLPTDADDPGTIALNARKETPKTGDSHYYLVIELTSVEGNQLSLDPKSELILRMDGDEIKLSPEGGGTALGNLRSAVFFKTEPDHLRQLGSAKDVEVKFSNNGKIFAKSLTPKNIENFRLFSDVNLPHVKTGQP